MDNVRIATSTIVFSVHLGLVSSLTLKKVISVNLVIALTQDALHVIQRIAWNAQTCCSSQFIAAEGGKTEILNFHPMKLKGNLGLQYHLEVNKQTRLMKLKHTHLLNMI